jgi:hypothetical protein
MQQRSENLNQQCVSAIGDEVSELCQEAYTQAAMVCNITRLCFDGVQGQKVFSS